MRDLDKDRSPAYGSVQDDPEEGAKTSLIKDERKAVLGAAKMRLIFALSLCTFIMAAEIIGSILSGSLAILADAGHLFTDVITYVISLTSIWLSQKPPSKKFTFGLLRAEVIGAISSITLSVFLAVVLTYFAAQRIASRDFEIDGMVMLIISVINFAGNLIQICQLQFGYCCCPGKLSGDDEDVLPGSHGHSHASLFGGHSGGKDGSINDHMNIRAACLHILGDSLFGFGLLVGSIVIFFKPEYKILDPILTIIFGVIVLLTLLGLFRESVHILMEGKPRGLDYDDVRHKLIEIEGVEKVHSLKMWSLTSDVHQICVHLVLGRAGDQPKILRESRRILAVNFGIEHTTIQTETQEDGAEFLCARVAGPA